MFDFCHDQFCQGGVVGIGRPWRLGKSFGRKAMGVRIPSPPALGPDRKERSWCSKLVQGVRFFRDPLYFDKRVLFIIERRRSRPEGQSSAPGKLEQRREGAGTFGVVVEWQTRRVQTPVPTGVRVRLPPTLS